MIRLLFLADTHLGFEYPFRPRIQRRRRGEDFFANFSRALEPAFQGKVDAVVHGGDLFFRSRIPARLVDMAFSPLKQIADCGIPVYIVPGNHERSRIPFQILSMHPHIHIFSFPRTFILEKEGFRLALAGFPYWYDNVRARILEILENTHWRKTLADCDAHLLCAHHCFEGAKVGPSNYTFRYNNDVIRLHDIPPEFSAVLSGHIHRRQILTKDLKGQAIATPVLYPGSIERTSPAERDEKKGYILVHIKKGSQNHGPDLSWSLVDLPTRTMHKIRLSAQGLEPQKFRALLREKLAGLDADSVVNLSIQGPVSAECLPILRASSLRSLAPPQMNITLAAESFNRDKKPAQAPRRPPVSPL
jgi:DNA repair exonuclease SbcCD nuclease subunit